MPTESKSMNGSSKRLRVDKSGSSKPTPSRIYSPFRTLGLVSNSTPFALTNLGNTFVITTSVGKAFQIYDAASLHLLFVSNTLTPEPISVLHSHHHYVFAAYGKTVGFFKRGRLLNEITVPSHSKIGDICIFGSYFLVATDSDVFVYHIDPKKPEFPELHTTLKISTDKLGAIVKLLHLPTYLNKIVVATQKSLILFNIRSGKRLFELPVDQFVDNDDDDDAESVKITAVDAAPVLDTMAVGTSNGGVAIVNVLEGRSILSFNVKERVTTLSFRTDGIAHLLVGTSAGSLLFYDMNLKKRAHVLRDVHAETKGGVARASFLPGQPIVVTCGGDNSLKEYAFDPAISTANDASTQVTTLPPRIMRKRGGHSVPPKLISFTDKEAHFILSAAGDQSLWSFSTRKDAQSHELSQRRSGLAQDGKSRVAALGPLNEFTALAYEANKQKRWVNILTAHKDSPTVHTWDGHRGIIGASDLKTIDNSSAKCVFITRCGNFGLVGSANGTVAVYNLQSGLLRSKYKCHSAAVTGIVVDARNKFMVSSSLDGTLTIFDFNSRKLVKQIELPEKSAATDIKINHLTGLIAISLDDRSIVVFDTQTQRIVRKLNGHSHVITSFDFSPEGQYITSASLDSTIRTWDLPTGACVDAFRVDNIVTCLRISPNGEWLATTHVRGQGISLWSNKRQFQTVPLRKIDESAGLAVLQQPSAIGEDGAGLLDGVFSDDEGSQAENDDDIAETIEQINENLVTLSLEPRSKFTTLAYFDVIKARNKATQIVEKPTKLPFFLQKNEEPLSTNSEPVVERVGPSMKGEQQFERPFTSLLKSGAYSGNFDAFIDHLKSLTPSATDLEIRSLETFAPMQEFCWFVDALTYRLNQRKDFELVQVWMSMLLRLHDDVIANTDNQDLENCLETFKIVNDSELKRLDAEVKYNGAVVKLLRQV